MFYWVIFTCSYTCHDDHLSEKKNKQNDWGEILSVNSSCIYKGNADKTGYHDFSS